MSCCAATVASREYLEEVPLRLERLENERMLVDSVSLGDDRYKTDFVVPEMHCVACIRRIESEIAAMPQVEEVRANLSLKTVSVVWNAGSGSIAEIAARLDGLGYSHHLGSATAATDADSGAARELLLALAVAGFSAANIMLLSVSVWSGAEAETAHLFHLVSGLIAIPTVAFSGRPFFRSAVQALAAKRLNMDVPISLAVVLALAMSIFESLTGGEEAYFDASVTLLFFLLIGRYLDQLMRHKARSAVERLHSLSARDGVLVGPTGEISHIPLKQIRPGMTLRVFAGERFPVNAAISEGTTEVDRSHVSGESEPVTTTAGNRVEAGALNLTGTVDVEALTDAEHSFLGEMRDMLQTAEKGRGDYLRVADRMARIYAPAVHLLALITFVVWMVATGGLWQQSLYTAIAVLIITCPCALGLAVPVAHVIGANRLMQNGVLMRNGTGLERLAEVDGVVFDKTGTLTTQNPAVLSLNAKSADEFPIIAALANKSSHPSSKAVREFLGTECGSDVQDIREIPGHGVEGLISGKKARLGKPEWVEEIAGGPTRSSDSVAFAVDGGSPCGFVLSETIREGAAESVSELGAMGIRVEILSGDRTAKVKTIAGLLGIDNWKAVQTPADKMDRLSALTNEGMKVLMVGDGINDAPALASGHVSMVPASASDIGRHVADFVFVRQSLRAVDAAVVIARFTARIVRQNFGLAIAYNCIAVPLAMAGYVTPLIAALAMSLSSIVVVANSFRIAIVQTDSTTRCIKAPEAIKNRIKEATA